MIAPFEVFLLILGLSVPLYWAIPASRFGARTLFLISLSAFLLFSLNPVLLLITALYCLWIGTLWGLYRRRVLNRDRLRFWSWSCFAPLALPALLPGQQMIAVLFGTQAAAAPSLVQFVYLGLSYTAIRGFLILREGIRADALRPAQSLLSLTFFPTFLSGPLAGPDHYARPRVEARLTARAALHGLSRIGWGLALMLILAPALARYTHGLSPGIASEWAALYLGLVRLFLDFSGYSETAIGVGSLYGVALPENFRQPWRARSVQDYWQRWHMSFTALISMYVFKPLLRVSGKPALAIFIAFLLAGVWHHLSWTFLVWGLGHGSALAAQMIVSRREKHEIWNRFPEWLRTCLGWGATMTYVAFLSAFANSPSIGDAWRMTTALIGSGQ